MINQLKKALTNDEKLLRTDFAYFVGIRSSFISYRCKDNLIIERYCPN